MHRNTSFRWRHRFLELTRHDRPERLAGIAEADELFLLESQKGSRRLNRPARRRGGVAAAPGRPSTRSQAAAPNYLGWRCALDGERIASPERFLRAAI